MVTLRRKMKANTAIKQIQLSDTTGAPRARLQPAKQAALMGLQTPSHLAP